MKTRKLLCLLVAIALCLSSFTAFAADAPTEEILTVTAPATEAVDYSDISNWAYRNEGKGKSADLFFICPTVDMGKDGNFNSDMNNEKYRESFVGTINMELGIYNDVASVYAPYYRQATFPVYNLPDEEREKYLSIAYEDIKNAFIYYAEHTDASRPLILAGFSQGADLTIRLMKDLFDEPKYARRLVAAYCIGWKLTEDEVKEYPHLKPANGETDAGVIIAFNSEDKDISSSLIIGKDEKTYAINPLNWKTTSETADKSLNKGACFTDYSGNIKEEIPNLTGAYIDEKRGALKVTDINPKDYPGKLFEDGIYHLYDYQFFFKNLRENVKARLSSYTEKNRDRIYVYYNDEIINFDVEPIIENGRTMAPFRAIFETMGAAVYYTAENGKQIVSARRGNDSLIITIGENKMYFNGKEIPLDVAAKIKNGRTLVPLRAISEAFECGVHWYGDSKTIRIYPPSECFSLKAERLEKIITDDSGNVLVEAIAYYPVMQNPDSIPILDEINEDYKRDAEAFIKEAEERASDARMLRNERGADGFTPFAFELTFEQNYNILGDLSLTTHKYMNVGGAHPTSVMESRTFNLGLGEERALSNVIVEEKLGVSLTEYVTNLFVNKLKELDPDSTEEYTADYVREYIGYLQFHLTPDSVVLYFNQGDLAPYAFGVISVEIPYAPELFYVDMSFNCLDEYVFELEYDKGYEWQILGFSDETLAISEETIKYDPKTLLSEHAPAGMQKITVKGIKKGNSAVIAAHVKKGEDVNSATRITIASFYVDENNKITLVSENDGMFLLK